MKTNPLVIRADANSSIGIGHVMRTLALAQSWIADGGQVFYAVGSCTNPSVLDRLNREQCQVIHHDAQPGSTVDAHLLAELGSSQNAVAVVIDGYHFDAQFLATVRSLNRTLVLDDCIHLDRYDCDWLLNQNLGADATSYKGKTDNTELLLGPGFSLLRSEFTRHRQQAKAIENSCPNILVAMGGSDVPNVTGKTIAALHSTSLRSVFRIIIGGANSHREELEKLASQDSRFELFVNVDDMSDHYRWADMAICAGGSSNWEMSYHGVPRIVVVLADNQIVIAQQLAKAKVCIDLGPHQIVQLDTIASAVSSLAADRQLRQLMSLNSQQLVDGRGVECVIGKLLRRNSRIV